MRFGMSSSLDGAERRAKSKKWSPMEVEQLMQAIQAANCPPEDLNWAEVATNVDGRTGKQCREKYKNDLRPDLSKDPWSSQEEYILARAHCQIGNQWADIAPYLPGRSENTIKNKWNATLRSKADAKSHTLLWTYAQTWQQQGRIASLDVFQMAVSDFCQQNRRASLEAMQVPESYFQGASQRQRNGGGPGGAATASSAPPGSSLARAGQLRAAPPQPPARRPNPRHSNRKRSRGSFASDEEEVWSDSDDNSTRLINRRQAPPKRTGSAVIQHQLRRQRQQQQLQQQQQGQQEHLELSGMPPPGFLLPPFPPPAAQPQHGAAHHAHAQTLPAMQQQPAAGLAPPPPALSDITNLAHLSPMEASATIKLCIPKHAQDTLKGFSFLSDHHIAPPAAPFALSNPDALTHSTAAGQQGEFEVPQQQQHRAPTRLQAPMLHMHPQQQQAAGGVPPTPAPGARPSAHDIHASSPALGTCRGPVWGTGGLNPWPSPAMPQDIEYYNVLHDFCNDGFGNSPAAFRICNNARTSDAHEQVPPLSVAKGRPSWLPELDTPYFSTLALLQSPASLMAQAPTQPVAPAPGTCLPTPRYANAPAGACGLLGSPTPGGAVAAAAAAAAAIAAANASTAVPSGGAAPTGAAGGCWGSMADMASGVPPLSGGFAPTPIRCTTAPGARAAALGGLPGGLLSPVPPLERVHAHLSPRVQQPVDRRLTMSAAVVTPLRAQAQQPPQPAQQPEQQLIAGQVDPPAIPAYLQPAPTPALHKAQRTPNRSLPAAEAAGPTHSLPLSSAPGHQHLSLAGALQSPLPFIPTTLHRLHFSSSQASPLPRSLGNMMHNLQQEPQHVQAAQQKQQQQQQQMSLQQQRQQQQHVWQQELAAMQVVGQSGNDGFGPFSQTLPNWLVEQYMPTATTAATATATAAAATDAAELKEHRAC